MKQSLTPNFDYVNLSDRVTRAWLRQVKECARIEVERWADRGVTEAFVTYKVSVICFDAEGCRIGGQKLFKLRTPEAQFALLRCVLQQRQ